MDKNGYIMVTRPQISAQPYLDHIRKLGRKPLLEPLMKIMPDQAAKDALKNKDLTKYNYLVLTSVHACSALEELSLPGNASIYCVGMQSAEKLAEKGFKTHSFTNSEELEETLKKEAAGKGLYLRGRHITRDLAASVKDLEELIIYEATPAQKLSHQAVELFRQDQISEILLFSSRTTETFAALVRAHKLESKIKTIKVLSISPYVLECVSDLHIDTCFYAETPDRKGMFALIKRICTP